jgi:hypothetical protein
MGRGGRGWSGVLSHCMQLVRRQDGWS